MASSDETPRFDWLTAVRHITQVVSPVGYFPGTLNQLLV